MIGTVAAQISCGLASGLLEYLAGVPVSTSLVKRTACARRDGDRRRRAQGGRPSHRHVLAAYFRVDAKGVPMRSAEFRAQCLCVDFGVVEAGCTTVIGECCKQSGMR